MVTISARHCRVKCIMGCDTDERTRIRDLFFDIEYRIDPPLEDEVIATVDYGEVIEYITSMLEKGQYHLIEYAAEEIIEALFSKFLNIKELYLTLHKPIPMLRVQETSVRVERKRA